MEGLSVWRNLWSFSFYFSTVIQDNCRGLHAWGTLLVASAYGFLPVLSTFLWLHVYHAESSCTRWRTSSCVLCEPWFQSLRQTAATWVCFWYKYILHVFSEVYWQKCAHWKQRKPQLLIPVRNEKHFCAISSFTFFPQILLLVLSVFSFMFWEKEKITLKTNKNKIFTPSDAILLPILGDNLMPG